MSTPIVILVVIIAIAFGLLVGYIIRKNVGEKAIGSAEQKARNLVLDAENKAETIKKEMLGELYAIRKGGKTDAEKREMAKTFKRVLDKNPALKKDENLVALSKIDTIISQPTKSVKKQYFFV